MPITTKEKIKKPRILLLDFDNKVVESLVKEGYRCVSGSSGYSSKNYNIPVHHSEIELMFWDCSKIKIPPDKYTMGGYLPSYANPNHPYRDIIAFCSEIRKKGGVVTLILGFDANDYRILSAAVDRSFSFYDRKTTTIFPNEEKTIFEPFFKRFILDENIKFSILWKGNFVDYQEFFLDEDNNHHASFSGDLLILPYIEDKKAAILMLLQDILPHVTDDEIFPNLATYEWLKDELFIPKPILDERSKLTESRKVYDKKVFGIKKKICILENQFSYLKQALIADDSELFPDGKKLKTQVSKMLSVLGFKVEDVDIKKREEGKSLAEDLDIQDQGFKALVEVKGTEKGAKSNWVKKDLEANRSIYAILNNLEASQVKAMLVFNHERRKDPRDRNRPFNDDPDLVKYAEKMNISLVPIYQLYLLCRDVLFSGLKKPDARKLIEKPGLFIYRK